MLSPTFPRLVLFPVAHSVWWGPPEKQPCPGASHPTLHTHPHSRPWKADARLDVTLPQPWAEGSPPAVLLVGPLAPALTRSRGGLSVPPFPHLRHRLNNSTSFLRVLRAY